jgi:hypothetical protein
MPMKSPSVVVSPAPQRRRTTRKTAATTATRTTITTTTQIHSGPTIAPLLPSWLPVAASLARQPASGRGRGYDGGEGVLEAPAAGSCNGVGLGEGRSS